MRVTVAALGPSFGRDLGLFSGPSLQDQGPEVRYQDRLKVFVETAPEETLGCVIDRAAASFDIGIGEPLGDGRALSDVLGGIAFYKPEDEERFRRPEPWPDSIRLLDEQGQPSWSVPWRLVTYEELMTASDVGLVDGDPLRPYLWPVVPQGEALGVQLPDALWLLEQLLKGIPVGAGSVIGRLALERLLSFRKVSEQGDPAGWRSRLERPDGFRAFLESNPRTTEEVASLLSCSNGEAEAMLWALGFTFDRENHRWHVAGDAAAGVIHQQLEQARRSGQKPTDDALTAALDDAAVGDPSSS